MEKKCKKQYGENRWRKVKSVVKNDFLMKLTERKRYHKIEKDSSRKEQKNGTTEEEKAGCCLWTGSSCIDFLESDAKYSGSAKIKSGMYRG